MITKPFIRKVKCISCPEPFSSLLYTNGIVEIGSVYTVRSIELDCKKGYMGFLLNEKPIYIPDEKEDCVSWDANLFKEV